MRPSSFSLTRRTALLGFIFLVVIVALPGWRALSHLASDPRPVAAILSLSSAFLAGHLLISLLAAAAFGAVVASFLEGPAAPAGEARPSSRPEADAGARGRDSCYRTLFDGSPAPMFAYDPETLAITAANQAALEHYGYDRAEFLVLTLRDITDEEGISALRRQASAPDGHASIQAGRHRTKAGHRIDIEMSSHEVTIDARPMRLVVALDVTARNAIGERLRQSQKMEAIGRLAGGVAHDFNNILNVVMGYADLSLRTVEEGGRLQRNLLEIRKAADRAALLTRQLLTFSRRQHLAPKAMDLNVIVREMEEMLRRLIGDHVQLVARLDAELGRASVDPGQISQVIMNLAVNARDAMPEGGQLAITTENVWLAEGDASWDVAPGPYIALAVSDTGCGMNEEVRGHLFEPFFTTKPKDKGTGLGLATVYGIVRQSGGAIQVASEVGRGSSFRILLPRTDAPATAVSPGPAPVSAGTETVLLAEDDPVLRTLVKEMLEGCGYFVLEAGDGREALQRARAHQGPIDVLLTDVAMPRMGGRELAALLRTEGRVHKIVYMSGTDASSLGLSVLEPGLGYVQKPVSMETLSRSLRKVLDSATASLRLVH
jgi:PAS domain S-box-containing protein